MFSHVMLGANDIDESKKFYDAIMAVLGYEAGVIDPLGRCFYKSDKDVFALTKPINGEAATHGNGFTLGFSATSPEQINKWHEVGLANGGRAVENPPGVRQSPNGDLYLAYLLDPAGNKICTLYRM